MTFLKHWFWFFFYAWCIVMIYIVYALWQTQSKKSLSNPEVSVKNKQVDILLNLIQSVKTDFSALFTKVYKKSFKDKQSLQHKIRLFILIIDIYRLQNTYRIIYSILIPTCFIVNYYLFNLTLNVIQNWL